MHIKIYQINLERDNDRVAFLSHDSIARFQGDENIHSEIYDQVFDGEVDCDTLEDVFEMFNIHHTADYQGRSLSVSDIVEVVESETIDSGFYFCDAFGFKSVEFQSEQAKPMIPSNTIRVVVAEPGKPARIADIDSSLEGMQKMVGGWIEAAYFFDEEVCIVCNEEGKINGLPLNRAVYAPGKEGEQRGELLDVISGTFFICSCGGENFGSLTNEQLERYKKLFRYPEQFRYQNGEIVTTPIKIRHKEQER